MPKDETLNIEEPQSPSVTLDQLQSMVNQQVNSQMEDRMDKLKASRLSEIPDDPETTVDARRILGIADATRVELAEPGRWHTLWALNVPARVAFLSSIGYVVANKGHVLSAPMAVGDKSQGGCYINGDTILMVCPIERKELFEQAVDLAKSDLQPEALQRAQDIVGAHGRVRTTITSAKIDESGN